MQSEGEYLHEHPGQGTSGVCTPRKTEDAYLVSVLVYSNDLGQGPDHTLNGTIITYSFASETHIRLGEWRWSIWSEQRGSHTPTLRVNRQAPSDRQIQDVGKTTGDGIDNPWSVARGKGTNACLALDTEASAKRSDDIICAPYLIIHHLLELVVLFQQGDEPNDVRVLRDHHQLQTGGGWRPV